MDQITTGHRILKISPHLMLLKLADDVEVVDEQLLPAG
jgi:hypothetical protein